MLIIKASMLGILFFVSRFFVVDSYETLSLKL